MVSDDSIKLTYTVRDVAKLLHIHSNTVRRWSDRGILRAYRITRRGDRRFKREDVINLLAEINKDRGDGKKPASL